MEIKKVLTIAGSDCSGGAGIQADLKTMLANGVYGMSALTALTAQNTVGVTGIENVSPHFLEKELDAVFTDIFPDAIKIGMVSEKELIEVIAEKLTQYKPGNVVLDPVMVATSGAKLLEDDAMEVLKEKLFPLIDLLTPNIQEAEALIDIEIKTAEDMVRAARKIGEDYSFAVLVKGGHSVNDANDLLYNHGNIKWYKGQRVNTENTHGTGCTLSSAIASYLAKGENMEMAVKKGKTYLTKTLKKEINLGKGSGPLNHGWCFM